MTLLKIYKITLVVISVIFFYSCALMESKTIYKFENTRWKLIKILNDEVKPIGNEIFITFRSRDNRILGFSGCSEILGFYKTDGNRIEITLESESHQICPNRYIELQLYEALPKIDEYQLDGQNLFLKSDKNIILSLIVAVK